MAASQSVLEILIQAVDESAAALEGAQTNLKAIGQEAIGAGVQIGLAGAALTAAYGGIVDSAANVQESQDALKQSVVDAMSQATTTSRSYATQVKFLQDKINGYKASIESATATLDTHTGSVEKSAASHAKAAASIATDQVNIAKYQAQLDILQNAQNLQGETVDGVTAKLEAQADANVSLGFSVSDSTNSLKQAFTATKSVSDAMQVNQAAMDLARAKNIDLATATNQVILAMNGQGRALATYGIQIKDGLSGMSALQAVQDAVNGQSQAYADTLSGQLSVAMASFNKLLSDMGNTQLPILTQLLQWIVKIIDAIDSWTQKHQKLTETILIFVAIVGGLLTLLGSLLVIFGTLAIVVAVLGGPFTLIIGLVALLATVIIANWTTISTTVQAIWNDLLKHFQEIWTEMKTAVNDALTWISNFIGSTISGIDTAWTAVWGAVSSFTGIWTGMQSAVTNAITFIQGAINNLISWAQGILAPILAPINAIGSAASAFGKTVTGGASAAVSALHLAAGGIVNGPTFALVGESGPEAVIPLSLLGSGSSGTGGGGGGINVFIQGGMYLDSGGAKMIADQIAKQIVQSIKVRNYAV